MEFKVQEVFTKEIRSKISEDPPSLHLASPSSWVCPPRLRRPVSNLQGFFFFFFFILALPTQTGGRSGRQAAGRRQGVLFQHAWGIPLPAPTSGPLATLQHPTRSLSPSKGPQGASAHHGKDCQQWEHFIHRICFWCWLSFSIVFKMGEFRIESKLFGLVDWLVLSGPKTKASLLPAGFIRICNLIAGP